MRILRYAMVAAAGAGVCMFGISCSDSGSTSPNQASSSSGKGTMVVRLTDAPFLTDSVTRADIFVVRVDARVAAVDSADADHDFDEGSAEHDGWTSIASPNASYNLVSLQNGLTVTLGEADLPPGTYNGFRLIIDPSRSSVTLKSGRVLTGTSSPGIKFPSGDRSGIKVDLSQPVTVSDGMETDLLVDFNLNDSFVIRGNSIDKNGLIFKPVIHATITDAALTTAKIRLINATSLPLDLRERGVIVIGAANLSFGASSACTNVPITAAPALAVTQTGSAIPFLGFAPVLTAGNSFSILAYPNATGSVLFATLPNAYTPASGDAGLRVFNATSTAAFDVFVSPPSSPFGAARFTNLAPGASTSFISIPAGTSQIRLTVAGGTTIALDLGEQTFVAGENVTLVIAPPSQDSATPRAFLVPGC